MINKLFLTAILIFVLFVGPAKAGIVGELGVLDVSGINPATGQIWAVGDTYRLVFITSADTAGTSTDITTYNTFVQGLADAAGLDGATWNVVGSTSAVDARDNTGTNPDTDGVGEAVLLMDGTTVIADNYADLWNGINVIRDEEGTWLTVHLDENGNQRLNDRVITGTDGDGKASTDSARVLGGSSESTPKVQCGRNYAPSFYNNLGANNWMRDWNMNATDQRPVYAMSDPMTVMDTNNASVVSPLNGDDAVAPANPLTLEWINPNPQTSDPVYVDVWFGTDPESLDGITWKKVVANGADTTSVDVNASAIGAYYWKVNANVGSPEIIEGEIWNFTTKTITIPDSDIFSVNFYAGTSQTVMLEADQSAGVDDWNTTGWINYVVPWGIGSPASQTILSTEGSTATFTLKEVRNGGPYSGTRTILLDDDNADLMDGHANGTEDPYDRTLIFDMGVSNIPLSIYDVVIYLGSQPGQFGDGTGKIVFNGGPEQDFTLKSGRFDGTFTEIVDGETPGNYIVFKNVIGTSFTVQVWGNGFNHIGPCGFQFGVTDTSAPSVNAGSDWITWSNEPVTLNNVFVSNNDLEAGDLTLTWSAEPLAGITVEFSDTGIEEPTVTVTKSAQTDDATNVKLTLTVSQFGKATVESSMTIDVYDDACKASLGAGTTVIGPADFDGNCVTGMEDLVRIAAAWLVDFSYKNPVEK